MQLPEPRSIGVRAAKAKFSALLDEVDGGDHVLVCRRSQPLAALIPASDLDRFRELARREEELAAVLRGRGYRVDPWGTPGVLEVVSRLGVKR